MALRLYPHAFSFTNNYFRWQGYGSYTQGLVTSSQGMYYSRTGRAANAGLEASGQSVFCRRSSSERYKTNIIPIPDETIEKVYDLEPITYTSINNDDPPERVYFGLIAEDVLHVIPELVDMDMDERFDKENKLPVDVSYEAIGVLLCRLIKMQQERIDALETETNNLLNQLNNTDSN